MHLNSIGLLPNLGSNESVLATGVILFQPPLRKMPHPLSTHCHFFLIQEVTGVLAHSQGQLVPTFKCRPGAPCPRYATCCMIMKLLVHLLQVYPSSSSCSHHSTASSVGDLLPFIRRRGPSWNHRWDLLGGPHPTSFAICSWGIPEDRRPASTGDFQCSVLNPNSHQHTCGVPHQHLLHCRELIPHNVQTASVSPVQSKKVMLARGMGRFPICPDVLTFTPALVILVRTR